MLSPIFFYTSYKIKKEDNGPIFYRQKRSGLYNIPFTIFKFRSMKVNNTVIGTHEKENPYILWEGKVPDDFIFKNTGGRNPNVTNIGAIIRKYSIDELPQLLNVLKGDMSIVGPRPEITQITSYYDSHQRKRLNVKPGITGWAQVNGRGNMNHGKKIELDLWYIKNWSFLLDIKIIFKTFMQVIIGKESF